MMAVEDLMGNMPLNRACNLVGIPRRFKNPSLLDLPPHLYISTNIQTDTIVTLHPFYFS